MHQIQKNWAEELTSLHPRLLISTGPFLIVILNMVSGN